MKTPKSIKMAHTPATQIGMGTYYGSAIKQKMGKMKSRLDFVSEDLKKKPPRSLA